MRRFLAVAVLGATLAFTASAALADDARNEPAVRPTQHETMQAQDNSTQPAIYGVLGPGPDVSVDRRDHDIK